MREILATHELVPIDNTPFDRERCGWAPSIGVNGVVPNSWINFRKHTVNDMMERIGDRLELDSKAKHLLLNIPWPATHSDGVRLLLGLGLEVKE